MLRRSTFFYAVARSVTVGLLRGGGGHGVAVCMRGRLRRGQVVPVGRRVARLRLAGRRQPRPAEPVRVALAVHLGSDTTLSKH